MELAVQTARREPRSVSCSDHLPGKDARVGRLQRPLSPAPRPCGSVAGIVLTLARASAVSAAGICHTRSDTFLLLDNLRHTWARTKCSSASSWSSPRTPFTARVLASRSASIPCRMVARHSRIAPMSPPLTLATRAAALALQLPLAPRSRWPHRRASWSSSSASSGIILWSTSCRM